MLVVAACQVWYASKETILQLDLYANAVIDQILGMCAAAEGWGPNQQAPL